MTKYKTYSPCIYKATSKTTGLSYIGQTHTRIDKRKRQHYLSGFNPHKSKRKYTSFAKALRQFGWDDFEWEILAIVDSKDDIQQELNRLEKYYIALYDSYNKGYNSNEGGNANKKYKYSTLEEKREAQRLRLQEKINNDPEGWKKHLQIMSEKRAGNKAYREKANARIAKRELNPLYKEEQKKRAKQKRGENKLDPIWLQHQKEVRDNYRNQEGYREKFNERRRLRRQKIKASKPKVQRVLLSEEEKRQRHKEAVKKYNQKTRLLKKDELNRKQRERRAANPLFRQKQNERRRQRRIRAKQEDK